MMESRSFEYPASGRVRTAIIHTDPQAPPRPVVVVVHGLFACQSIPELTLLRERLAESFDVVGMDLRGHGREPGFFTWGREERRDLGDLVTFLRELHPAVGVFGFSLGGYIAILSAATAPPDDAGRPDALCTIGTPAHLDLWRYRFRLKGYMSHARLILGRHARLLRNGQSRLVRPSLRGMRDERAVDVVSRVAPIPLMIIHGKEDWLIHPDQAWELYQSAEPPREILMIEGGMHAEYMLAQDPEWLLRPAGIFFDRTLREPRGPRRDTATDGDSAFPEVRISLDRS